MNYSIFSQFKAFLLVPTYFFTGNQFTGVYSKMIFVYIKMIKRGNDRNYPWVNDDQCNVD